MVNRCGQQGMAKAEILEKGTLPELTRNLPVLPNHERDKLVNRVKDAWEIDSILKSPINPQNILHIKNGNNLIDNLSTKLGESLCVITPPVKNCLFCKKSLSISNTPIQIAVHTQVGSKIFTKYLLKCQNCRQVEQSSAKLRKAQ